MTAPRLVTDYAIIDLSDIPAVEYPQPTPVEIWQQMVAGDISPVVAEARLARLTGWPGYVRIVWEAPSQ